MTITMRPAERRDLPALIALYRDDALGRLRESDDPADNDAYEQGFDRVAADPSTCIYVAERDGEIIGTFQLTITPGLSRRGAVRATIEAVRTRADLRGRGVGARMMEYALREARRRGADVAQLTSDLSRNDAHRFYERLGFSRSHAGFKRSLTSP